MLIDYIPLGHILFVRDSPMVQLLMNEFSQKNKYQDLSDTVKILIMKLLI